MRSGEFEAPEGEGKGERTRLAGVAQAVEKDKELRRICIVVARTGPPRSGMPTEIGGGHDLDRVAPVVEFRRGKF